MTLFSKYNLNEVLNKSLKNINFTNPTPIQEKSIPELIDVSIEPKLIINGTPHPTGVKQT
jgi:superfamily II DNA/RNA helicase